MKSVSNLRMRTGDIELGPKEIQPVSISLTEVFLSQSSHGVNDHATTACETVLLRACASIRWSCRTAIGRLVKPIHMPTKGGLPFKSGRSLILVANVCFIEHTLT